MTQICITIDTPVVDVNEFVNRTGIPMPTVRKLIAQHEIPVLPREGKQKILINMVLYTARCAEQKDNTVTNRSVVHN